jgi:TonB-dependent starch-binding outer membrane protein SusC
MYSKSISIILLCFFIFCESNAQIKIKLQGTIVDSITNMPIEGVYIKISNRDYNAISNKSGYFSMSIDQEILKTVSIIINGLGYKTIKLPISKLNNEPIKIYQEIVTLPEVIVRSLFNWDNFAKK